MNLNTKTRSSTLYANARAVLDSILFKFQKQPKKPPPTSSFREERGRRDRSGARRGESLFSLIWIEISNKRFWELSFLGELFLCLLQQIRDLAALRETFSLVGGSKRESIHVVALEEVQTAVERDLPTCVRLNAAGVKGGPVIVV